MSFALMNLARLIPRETVGVTMFYGLALSSFSALNYAFLGSIDYHLVLIAGTLPGVYLGTHVNAIVERDRLKGVINLVIMAIGLFILIQSLKY